MIPRLLFAALAMMNPALEAASTTTWEMTTYQDFLNGRFQSVSLSRDGRLRLALPLDTLFASDQPSIWSVAQSSDGSLYLGTGHRGRVYRVDPKGKGELLWTAQEPEVFAVALDRKGVLYAATSPNGKIYRIENGKAAEYFAPGATYLWALAFGPDGALYAGAGDQGKIFRVEGPGKGEVYYETGQTHVTSLAFDAQGRLLAGSEPNGILYRVSAKDKAFVLYDAGLPEIRTIVAAADGSIYAAALGGSIAKRTSGAQAGQAAQTNLAAPSVSITVTDQVTQGGVEIKPKPDAASQTAQAAAPAPAPITTPVIEYPGMEKSAVYKINPDHTVETLWSSKEENVYDLLVAGDRITFSTDTQGRIYRMGPDRKAALLVQAEEAEVVRLIDAKRGLLAATGNMGKIYRLGDGMAAQGSYESPVHDAGSVARWGRLQWRGEAAGKARIAFRTRTGNSARPDRTWSEWSEPLAEPGALIPSPNARYIQWKGEFTGAGDTTPELESVSVAYLPQNTPPMLSSITVTTQWAAAAGSGNKAVAQPAATASYSITVTDTGDAGASSLSGTPTQRLARAGAEQIQLSWAAEDRDGDQLVYALYFRGEEEREWKLLKDNLPEAKLELDSELFADGKYFFRVAASDRPSNSAANAREAELVSAPIVVDHTPPRVTPGSPRRDGGALVIEVEAVDDASPLRRCEYSLDANPWVLVEAVDGVTDSPRERFVIRLQPAPAGEHLVAIRTLDSAGNAGLAKVVVR